MRPGCGSCIEEIQGGATCAARTQKKLSSDPVWHVAEGQKPDVITIRRGIEDGRVTSLQVEP